MNLLNRFRKQTSTSRNPKSQVTIRRSLTPNEILDVLSNYSLMKSNFDIYHKIAKTIPAISRALNIYANLVSYPVIKHDNGSTKKYLDMFLKNVNINNMFTGVNRLIRMNVIASLKYGYSWGEIVLNESDKGVHRVMTYEPKELRIQENTDGIPEYYYVSNNFAIPVKFDIQELILYNPYDIVVGSHYGTSLLDSLPFVSQIFIRILDSIQNQFWRVGDSSFWVKFSSDGKMNINDQDRDDMVSNIESALKTLWQNKHAGRPGDIVTDLLPGVTASIETIGADALMVDISSPANIIREQLEAGLGLPGYFIGLYHGGTTGFKISDNLMDLCTQRIYSIRRDQEDQLREIIDRELVSSRNTKMLGYEFEWPEVNLKDKVEQAKANSYNTNAMEKRINALIVELESGRIDEITFQNEMLLTGLYKTINYKSMKTIARSVAEKEKYKKVMDVIDSIMDQAE